MRETWRNVGIVAVFGLFLAMVVVSERKNQQLVQNNAELEDFLISNGKLVELFDEGISEDGTPIVVTETGGIPMYERHDKVDAMIDMPIWLYYPDATKVRLHFEMDLSPRFEEWDLYFEEELVPPDPEKEHYYFLDLEKKGTHIMEVRYPDPDTGEESHIYFSIAW